MGKYPDWVEERWDDYDDDDSDSNYPDWVEERFGDDIPDWAQERWG